MVGSKIFRELCEMELQKIAGDLFGSSCRVLSANLLKGGLFNTTYKLTTDARDEALVLRVAPVNKNLLFDFEKNMMSAEPIFHNLLSENAVPVPKVLRYSPEGSVIEREYIITEFIDSVPMSDPSLRGEGLGYVYEEVGRLAGRIHGIRHEKFGRLRPSGRGAYDSWLGFVRSFADEAADKARKFFTFLGLRNQ